MQLSAAVLMRRRAAAVVMGAVACALTAGIVELGYLWLKSSSVFVLQSVAVRGGTESDRVAVRDAVARAAAGRSLLQISASDVASAIESVPTIRLASVDRDFPHTLRVHVVPERAVALAVGTGKYRSVVASSGRVLRVFDAREVLPALPRVWTTPNDRPIPGGSIHRPEIRAALEALAARPRDFRAKVANVKVEPDRGIVMRLNGGLDMVRRLRCMTSCARRRGCCATTRRRTIAQAWSTPMCRRPTAPRSCRAAAIQRPRTWARRRRRATRARKTLRMAPDAHAYCEQGVPVS